MDARVRHLVRLRARGRCEYCRLSETCLPVVFHIEHIVARQHGGADDAENLALACPLCNCLKGPNLTAIDPVTETVVRVFDPRRDPWDDHFRMLGVLIVGKSPTGRATVMLLEMNDEQRQRLRAELQGAGEWNPA